MRMFRVLVVTGVALVTVIVATACRSATSEMPRGYGPIALAEGERCPSVGGRYFDSSAPVMAMLVMPALRNPPASGDLAWIELTPADDSTLLVAVMYQDSVSVSGTLRRGGPWHGDYYCEEGWLKVRDARIPQTWDAEMKDGEFFPRRHLFWVAPNKAGALVARLQFIDFEEFGLWCGDGCKGFPIPGTFEYRETWSLAEAFDPDLPAPIARQREAERQEGVAALEAAKRDRRYQEVQLLENGPPDPELETVRRRALLSLPEGVLLRGVSRHTNRFHLSVEFEAMYQLENFLERLGGSGPVDELGIAPLFRGKTTKGTWVDVVYVRYGTR